MDARESARSLAESSLDRVRPIFFEGDWPMVETLDDQETGEDKRTGREDSPTLNWGDDELGLAPMVCWCVSTTRGS